ALGEPLEDGAWVVRVYHKPFVDWIWFGCLLMAFGGILAVTDRRYRLKVHSKHVETTTVVAEGKRVASNAGLAAGGKKA
ncbi:MAG: cytochrome c-type biogenesis CcmF C-terminal domain-containing protein, partial [Pseudomonadota bacterium]